MVTIDQAWIRAMPPSQKSTAAYLEVTNGGSKLLKIVGASSPVAKKAEMHVSREADGYVRMEHLDHLLVPPGETLRLAPGGTHLMLLGLEIMPLPGSVASICLEFSSGQVSCTQALVQKAAPDAGQHSHH